jgi:two-component system cell cycle response regulator
MNLLAGERKAPAFLRGRAGADADLLRRCGPRGYMASPRPSGPVGAVNTVPSPPTTPAGPSPDVTGQRRAFVVVLAGDRMGEMFELDPSYTTIGRGLTATVRINDEGISRTHAAVRVDQGVYYLSDAGSTNGTFANGERVDRHPLREGDKIQLGAASVLRFTFHEDNDDDLQRDLYESALRDRLTGLFSRAYFENRVESDVAMALRHGKPLALAMFAVDDPTSLSQSRGRAIGEQVYRELARKVTETTRGDDLLARLGDETFVHLCRDVDAMRAARAAQRIRETLAAHTFPTSAGPLQISVSLGVADLALLHEPTAQALIKAAESALVVARRAGGNHVEIYDPENEPTRLV